MLPILISGGSVTSREKEAIRLANEASSAWDTLILNGEEDYGIEAIKELISKLNRKPYSSPQQTVVILEAQNLTLEAQNVLLKTLEEAPDSAKIVLTAPTAESLLSTVTSRCQKSNLPFEMKPLDEEKLKKFLSKGFYERWLLKDSLDLDNWLSYWRGLMLGNFTPEGSSLAKKDLLKLAFYTRLIVRMQGLLKRRASSKLVKSILLLQAPLGIAARANTKT